MQRHFILTNIGILSPVDIICTTDESDHMLVTDYLRRLGVGFVKLSCDDAIKLLMNGSCVGIGCFLCDESKEITDLRKQAAEHNQLMLMRKVGFVRFNNTVGLNVPQELQRDYINNRFAKRCIEYANQKDQAVAPEAYTSETVA